MHWAHLPAQSCHKVLIALSASTVAQDGDLVLLPWGHVQHGNLVRGTTEERGGGGWDKVKIRISAYYGNCRAKKMS